MSKTSRNVNVISEKKEVQLGRIIFQKSNKEIRDYIRQMQSLYEIEVTDLIDEATLQLVINSRILAATGTIEELLAAVADGTELKTKEVIIKEINKAQNLNDLVTEVKKLLGIATKDQKEAYFNLVKCKQGKLIMPDYIKNFNEIKNQVGDYADKKEIIRRFVINCHEAIGGLLQPAVRSVLIFICLGLSMGIIIRLYKAIRRYVLL